MKVLVCGGRDFADQKLVDDTLSGITPRITQLVQGGAYGADQLAEKWAYKEGVKNHRHSANWARDGKAAGPIRNSFMLSEHPDIKLVIAFPGGKGTADMVKKAKSKGIKVLEVRRNLSV